MAIRRDSAVLTGNAVVALVPQPVPEPERPPQVRTSCPDCAAELELLRVIPGRAAEYWTMRCAGCGAIHMDIVDGPRA
ncbi:MULTISPECIES: hypothetical protein [unclassified Bradyrhizobium]|uniref:hypothetical protein n=1 Tax=unclassified Bradyrhizobium TaxID=2631580 RepID=UPI002479E1B5|nr:MULTISPECIES: hypothetical protein [unclassified Bradyrhizobium]WGS24129.1 hypothetical protein MTX22_38500 [Bradyrhizobium sp. ISRA463]WGS31548.1 hypothetical protein MTX19_35925 [Bradyrhizobium sp. ISRA464]